MTTNPTPEEEVLAISAEMKKLRRKYRKLSKQANSIALPYESEAEREKFHNILEEKLQVSDQLKTLKSLRLHFRVRVILARIDATISDGNHKCTCGNTDDFTINYQDHDLTCNKCGARGAYESWAQPVEQAEKVKLTEEEKKRRKQERRKARGAAKKAASTTE